jgi:hypothetical protein
VGLLAWLPCQSSTGAQSHHLWHWSLAYPAKHGPGEAHLTSSVLRSPITCINGCVVDCSWAIEYETKQGDTAEPHNFNAFQFAFYPRGEQLSAQYSVTGGSLRQVVLSDAETDKHVCCVTQTVRSVEWSNLKRMTPFQ